MTEGLRKVLSYPLIFNLFRFAIGGKNFNDIFIKQYVKPFEGVKLIDVGCGTGNIIEYLPEHIDYKGYDISAAYIDSANKKYGHRASFAVGNAAESINEPDHSYDIAMMVGVLHHLDDSTISRTLANISRILKPGGRFVSIDGVFVSGQSWLARQILKADRGEFVREKDQYLQLVKPHFTQVDHTILHNLLRIPYSHIIMVGQKA
jgi:ubiquinone/menaquinone biosynthesis C-methylase UbiE